jgi:hypothetical protein
MLLGQYLEIIIGQSEVRLYFQLFSLSQSALCAYVCRFHYNKLYDHALSESDVKFPVSLRYKINKLKSQY